MRDPAEIGRVGVWRGCFRSSMSFAAPFAWRCLSGSTMALFPDPSHRTGRGDCPHRALGQDLTPSSTTRRAQAGSGVRAVVPVEVRESIAPAPSSPDFVLGAQPPAQPHCCVSVERPIRLAGGSYLEVVRPSAKRAIHFAHQRCGLLPCSRSVGQGVDFLDHALNAFL
jgi:hypothetical protein